MEGKESKMSFKESPSLRKMDNMKSTENQEKSAIFDYEKNPQIKLKRKRNSWLNSH